jgi:glycosyltransferase involved in cell wall biosynthesis
MFSFMMAGLIAIRAAVRRHKIEGVIAFFSLPSGVVAYASGARYIVSLRGGDVPGNEPSLWLVHRLLAPLRRTILKNSRAIVANSAGLQHLSERSDHYAVRVIANGVDTEYFTPRSAAAGVPDSLDILFVGRLHIQKNVEFLLRQLSEAAFGKFQLHIVGDGPEKEHLVNVAAACEIGSNVIWHGWRSRAELRGIYQSCDCLVNPSSYEGMPNAVLEAMACGLPVVATRVAGNEELVVHGETGFLFDPGDTEQFQFAMQQLRESALRRRMGEAARTRALLYSWETAAAQYIELLKGNDHVSN